MRLRMLVVLAGLLGVVAGTACRKAAAPETTPAGAPAAAPDVKVEQGEEDLEPAPEATPLPPSLVPLNKPFKGDLDGMVKRRMIRVLTVQNPVLYFIDRGREVGITYDAIQAFEKDLNKKLGNKLIEVHVIPVPVPRDQLFSALVEGRGDISAAMLTVTPERQKLVDFSDPLASGVKEVLVTGPGSAPVASLEDLSGREVYVRASSAYAEHIKILNAHFQEKGKPLLTVTPAPEALEDGDILEMVSAGLVPATVVDEVIADLYTPIFPTLRKHEGIASKPQDLAWAFRKNSPRLAAEVNAFVKTHRLGTTSGNVLLNKYLKTTKWVKNARSDEGRRRLQTMVQLFQKYGDKYELDFLLMAAQGYQESGLDQSVRSHVGAIGVMQVMPATARDKAVNIPDIEKLESNIHAGIKYNRWVIDSFFQDPAISKLDKGLLAFASYNAGPGRVAQLRQEAARQGLDPNKWFGNVELIAAKRVGRETVTYVANIYKYYLAYQLMVASRQATAAAKADAAQTLRKQ